MTPVHHRKLPSHSDLLAGPLPPHDDCFRSDRLQIWFNRTNASWQDPAPHYHVDSDEIFIVLKGSLVVEIEGEHITVGPDEMVAFPAGTVHSVVDQYPPLESLMIRAPSIQDKIYVEAANAGATRRFTDADRGGNRD